MRIRSFSLLTHPRGVVLLSLFFKYDSLDQFVTQLDDRTPVLLEMEALLLKLSHFHIHPQVAVTIFMTVRIE
ncbi:hypothetical protein ACTXT7_004426 [Hymenolepis weldensis]